MAVVWKRRKQWIVSAIAAILMLVIFVIAATPPQLSITESQCVGSWIFSQDGHPDKKIVYHLRADRRAVEEHYYLSSAYPHVPRLTFHGRWDVDSTGRLTVQPSRGLYYAGDALSGYMGSFVDNGRQAWSRPVLTRFYMIEAASEDGLDVRASKEGRFRMLPYHQMPQKKDR